MTFNLAARQKPEDISPNQITACSSPSSHNFQLDSLTAARSARGLPAGNSPARAAIHSHYRQRVPVPETGLQEEEEEKEGFIFQEVLSVAFMTENTHTCQSVESLSPIFAP